MLEWKQKRCDSDIVLYFLLRVFDTVPLVYFCIILKYCAVEEASTVAFCSSLSWNERPASLRVSRRTCGFPPFTSCSGIITRQLAWKHSHGSLPEVSVAVVLVVILMLVLILEWLTRCCGRLWGIPMWTRCLERSSTKMPSSRVFLSHPQCHERQPNFVSSSQAIFKQCFLYFLYFFILFVLIVLCA